MERIAREYEKIAGHLRDPAILNASSPNCASPRQNYIPRAHIHFCLRLTTPDPEVDAERLFGFRRPIDQKKMNPRCSPRSSHYAEISAQRLERRSPDGGRKLLLGAYSIVPKPSAYYQRLLDAFPDGKNAYNAEWRIAWIAFLNKQPDADQRLTAFLAKYPVSANAVDALYWLGRSAERSGNPAHARSYYKKAIERFPQTYFARAAAKRLGNLGAGEENPADILTKIPEPPPLRPFDEPVPANAADRWAKAQALRIIAFDASAELELKNAYFATSSPRFLLEAAQAAFDQGHFAAGMAYARIILPSFESRQLSDAPIAVWKTLYPLPYEAALRREAARNDFDPMFAAGLIRQESTFQADIVSYANAIGLMQVLPKTGKILAKQLKIRYNKKLLYDANYNLQLGMLYIANLVA